MFTHASSRSKPTAAERTRSAGFTSPVTVVVKGDKAQATKVYNAAANTGMGNFTVTPTVSVSVPANAFAGSYSSTLTIALVSGP